MGLDDFKIVTMAWVVLGILDRTMGSGAITRDPNVPILNVERVIGKWRCCE